MLPAIAGSWADRARRLLPPGSTVYVARSHINDHTYNLYAISGDEPIGLAPYINMFVSDHETLSPEARLTVLGNALWGKGSGMDRYHAQKYKRWLKSLPDGFPSNPEGHVYSLRYL